MTLIVSSDQNSVCITHFPHEGDEVFNADDKPFIQIN